MGIKLQAVVLWLFFFILAIGLVFRVDPVFWVLLILAGLLLKEWLYHLPMAKKNSRNLGLKAVILIPVNYRWANILVWISAWNICNHPINAYEVHIDPKQAADKNLRSKILHDLEVIKNSIPGLFLWETSMPIPHEIRKELRRSQKEGVAFWKKGGFPIPRFPGTELELRKTRRHGAIYHVPENIQKNIQEVMA